MFLHSGKLFTAKIPEKKVPGNPGIAPFVELGSCGLSTAQFGDERAMLEELGESGELEGGAVRSRAVLVSPFLWCNQGDLHGIERNM